MPEESTTPDPVELARRAFAAVNRGDLDALMSLYAPEAVFDMTRTVGFAPQGRAAIRGFIREWMSSYDEVAWIPEELFDLGSGVVFAVVSQTARPVGVTGWVQRRDGWVFVVVDGLLTSHTAYFEDDIDEARAAAERLAEERGQAMSQENVAIVRRSIDAYSRRDVKTLREISDPGLELDWSASRGAAADVYRGFEEVLRFYTEWYELFEMTVIEPERFIPIADSVVVPNVGRLRGRDGIEASARSALAFTLHDHTITRIRLYQETDEALRAVGLAE